MLLKIESIDKFETKRRKKNHLNGKVLKNINLLYRSTPQALHIKEFFASVFFF